LRVDHASDDLGRSAWATDLQKAVVLVLAVYVSLKPATVCAGPTQWTPSIADLDGFRSAVCPYEVSA
jgi:hypothetical protein